MPKAKPTLAAATKRPPKIPTVDDRRASAFIRSEGFQNSETPKRNKGGRPLKTGAKGRTWKQVTLYLPPEVLTTLRHRAVDDDCDLSDIVAAALAAWLKAPSRKARD